MEGQGEDSDGAKYSSIDELWGKELGAEDGRSKWYAKAESHWEAQEASLNGVLGGYPETNAPDLRESRRFLNLIKKAPSSPQFGRVIDCGAGIGRVSCGLLQQLFQTVDIVEPNARLLETARESVKPERAGIFVEQNLQDFEPEPGTYDVIWAQWVLLYLPDDDLSRFLDRCKRGLKPSGLICIKENVVLEGKWVVDREDNSIARTDSHFKTIFERAGLAVKHELKQSCWPQDLIPVKMYALRPISMKRPAAAAMR